MSDKELSEALRRIIEKELKSLSSLLPKDVISNVEKKISPQVEGIIEKGGYIKKSKFDNLERVIKDLEERINELEKN
jgi:hypothetical protein|tara:strand:+ start:23816 stop:24046 length:231 start_codon:yes stop_codon:yes gene_type:complete